MKMILQITRKLGISFYALLVAVLLSGCEPYQYKTEKVCHVLIEKQVVNEPINGWGAFEEHYYFLYDNQELKEVSLHSYMEFKTGQTLCWNETYRVK